MSEAKYTLDEFLKRLEEPQLPKRYRPVFRKTQPLRAKKTYDEWSDAVQAWAEG